MGICISLWPWKVWDMVKKTFQTCSITCNLCYQISRWCVTFSNTILDLLTLHAILQFLFMEMKHFKAKCDARLQLLCYIWDVWNPTSPWGMIYAWTSAWTSDVPCSVPRGAGPVGWVAVCVYLCTLCLSTLCLCVCGRLCVGTCLHFKANLWLPSELTRMIQGVDYFLFYFLSRKSPSLTFSESQHLTWGTLWKYLL